MRKNRIVVVVALALSASLFTRGYGEEGPVPVHCAYLGNYSCIGFMAPSMPWPGGPTETPINCAAVPPFAAGRPCSTGLDCPNSPSATHNVSQNDWNTLRVTPHAPTTPASFYECWGWGWWGKLVSPAEPFVCQWNTSCTSCRFSQGALSGLCSAVAAPVRSMPQVSGGGSDCFIHALF